MADEKWYYSLSTGEVRQGKADSWSDRMGPYDTEQEAADALKTAHARTAAADAAERAEQEAEDNWGEPASWEK